jgi:glycerol-3-phosphate dehydrogenase
MQCRTVGVRLGAGESLHDILSSSRQVAEGVSTAGQSTASHSCVCGVGIMHKHQPVFAAAAAAAAAYECLWQLSIKSGCALSS